MDDHLRTIATLKEEIEAKNSLINSLTASVQHLTAALSTALQTNAHNNSQPAITPPTTSQRSGQLVISGVPFSSEEEDASIVRDIASSDAKFFRPQKDGSKTPHIVVEFKNSKEKIEALRSFKQVSAKRSLPVTARCRQNFTKEQNVQNRQAWKTVIELNDKAKKRLYSVRNVADIILLKTPGEWEVHERPHLTAPTPEHVTQRSRKPSAVAC